MDPDTDFTELEPDDVLRTVRFDESEGHLDLEGISITEGDEFYDPQEDLIFRVVDITTPEHTDATVTEISLEYEEGQRITVDEEAFAYGLTDGRSRELLRTHPDADPDPWIVPIDQMDQEQAANGSGT